MSESMQSLLWNLAGYGVVVAIGAAAVASLYAFTAMPRFLPLPRWRGGKWTGYEVVLAFFAMVGFPQFIAAVLQEVGFYQPLLGIAPEIDVKNRAFVEYNIRSTFIASPLILAFTLAALFAVMFARTRTRPHHFGLTWTRWRPNLVLGCVTVLAATPIVLGVFAFVKFVLPERPEPLIELAKKFQSWEWATFAFRVIIAAPIIEEIVFRGILQNWLRRASLSGQIGVITMTVVLATTGMRYHDAEHAVVSDASPIVFALLLVAGYGYWLFRLARGFALEEAEIQAWQPEFLQDDPRAAPWKDANAALAVLGSAMLFAVVHSEAWPAPIPLFVMGLVLGTLAGRTNSLLGPIVYHALFNTLSFIALLGSTMWG